MRGLEVPAISIVDHVMQLWLSELQIVKAASDACHAIVVLNYQNIGQGIFLPFSVLMMAVVSRVIVLLRAHFDALLKCYESLLAIIRTPIMCVVDVSLICIQNIHILLLIYL